ncbi:FkbM family methyltransferase [uncultured Methylibium sp.]|uniref:FkbM family methyltransferase n=1 Tax=uncultured Methylibium sp. TaxID=381093 RepID=UPI0025D15E63|nr:FkbM family methyltransferase [uncultured Methylibium sp.]
MLITEQYRAEQAALHAKGNYGTAALQYGEVVAGLLHSTGARSILDYGCGSKRSLLQALNLPDDIVYEGYDPAIPDYAGDPMPAELVCCIDVLEHIEPTFLDNVLDHLARLCDPYGFFTVHSGPAVKVLSDGRNAHLTQQGPSWWLPRLQQRFEVIDRQPIPSGFVVVVRSLQSDTELPRPSRLALAPAPAAAVVTRVSATATSAQAGAGESASMADVAEGPPQTVLKYHGRRIVFNTPNEMTAWRVRTLFEKEPDTIRWIEQMAPGSTLIDIGANVGMYSLFSAVTLGIKVFAFEPESQNYALLNANIADNGMSEQVLAFPLALSDTMQLDKLYLSKFSGGGSCHSFGEQVGFDLKPRKAAFTQGAFSVTLDQLVESGAVPVPDYVKLDVDGIEHKVLQGARRTLADSRVREVLVELNTHLAEHNAVIKMLQSLGFAYDPEQVRGALRSTGAFEGVGEFIFRRGVAERIDFKKTFSIGLPPDRRGRLVLEHVLGRVARAEIVEDPFPYLVVDEVFPKDYYAEMLAHFPAPGSLRPIGETGRVSSQAYQERNVVLFTDEEFARMSTEQQTFWRNLSSWMYSDAFLSFFVQKFARSLEPRLQRILAADEILKARGDALLVNDQTNYAIGPHTDAPHRLVTFLFYLPKDDSMRELGTSIYRAKDPDFVCWGGPHHKFELFERVGMVEFLPNRLLSFPKTERSFHGVPEITRTGVNRPLLINNIRVLNSVTH